MLAGAWSVPSVSVPVSVTTRSCVSLPSPVTWTACQSSSAGVAAVVRWIRKLVSQVMPSSSVSGRVS